MGHAIRVLVARYEQLAAADLGACVPAPLAQGYGLAVAPDWDDEKKLLERLGEVLGRSSAVAYIWTDYFGGAGTQGARVWTPSDATGRMVTGSGSINAALALIGVMRADGYDEFDSIGLGWYRSNEDWAAFARDGKARWQHTASATAVQAWQSRR